MRHPASRPQRGQSLVIFALIAMVLLAVVGLAVDGGFSYFASDRLERGAMAAALAGVPDMPNFNTSPNDATSTAIAAAGRNGWTSGGANNVVISVQRVPDPQNAGLFLNNQLAVTITSDVPVFFMRLLGFGSHRESRKAVAEYLRPITFGQPGSTLGSTVDNLGTANNFYFMRSEGWGTDRGQGDPYGPNPANTWTSVPSAPNLDVHALSGTGWQGTEATTQPLATMPARGGQNYQIYVPAGQTANVQVYNPVFAPDNAAPGANTYNYHEDDTDFKETTVAGAPAGSTCNQGAHVTPSYCVGPSSAQAWPTMSYTVYQSVNPFDHTRDVWLSNLRLQSIDGSAGTGTYTIPGAGATTHALSTLSYYHQWADVQLTPTAGSQEAALAVGGTAAPTFSSGATRGLTGGANGTTYRLRVDQLDESSGDPATNGRANTANSQAHKGYAVRVVGPCATATAPTPACTVTALDDITIYTPVKAGGFTMPLVSIPPEYEGRDFTLFIYDPGDVTCNTSGCSNIITLLQPNGATATTGNANGAVFATGSGEGDVNNPATYAAVAPVSPILAGQDAIQTQDSTKPAGQNNIYNGRWIEFYVTVPAGTSAGDPAAYHNIINPADPSTWYWKLQYTTAQAAGDTISANLGFSGAPVHLIYG